MIMLLPVPWIRIMYVRNMMPLYAHRGHGHGDVNGEGESISNLYDEKTHEIALLCHLTLPSTHNNILLGRLLLLFTSSP